MGAEAFSRQPALRAAQRADLRRPRRGPAHRDRRRRAAVDLRRHDPARGGVHERPAAPAGRPDGVRRALERRAGDRRRPARGRRQLAVPVRPRAVARDADRALRAGHRHPPGGAQGPGRAPARVVRRALDHLDLRPVRGERPLLPGAAAARRRRGPGGAARARRRRRGCRSCACTTARSTAGTARSTTSCAAARTCAWRTACCRPARRSSTSSPTPPSTTGSCACWPSEDRPLWSQMSFSAAEENFHARRARRHRRARVLARPGRGAGRRAGAAAAAADRPRGPRGVGRRRRPTATGCWASSSAAACTQRNGASLAGRRLPPPLRGPQARPHGRAARDDRALPRAHARQRARSTSGPSGTDSSQGRPPKGGPTIATADDDGERRSRQYPAHDDRAVLRSRSPLLLPPVGCLVGRCVLVLPVLRRALSSGPPDRPRASARTTERLPAVERSPRRGQGARLAPCSASRRASLAGACGPPPTRFSPT